LKGHLNAAGNQTVPFDGRYAGQPGGRDGITQFPQGRNRNGHIVIGNAADQVAGFLDLDAAETGAQQYPVDAMFFDIKCQRLSGHKP
jgi:hypothetical protein